MSENISLIKSIADLYAVELHFVELGDNHCQDDGEDAYLERSACAGNVRVGGEIWLGIYEDEDLKIASFFHEMGHLLDLTKWHDSWCDGAKESRIMHEQRAWNMGRDLALLYGINFTDKTNEWIKEQVESYRR